ncbi:Outer membrane protein beta-barrel domain-containing protein [Draconibacterium orientale]|uniref:Outer membrane protein beta-barrel domain-containing protein n=1 Tax=Draconibacterium orientale TaxID=1168034 RepID=X5E4N9_9BACT|nr:DUF6089 family protein [Draconibacterium orientale]AHW62440.1 hypothetical protein FH5T_21945 [Draconibacterium orientale]SEU08460.1 Outer membrane protein beta-barrel domain-containing protein [Draconibacterium orientale]
MRKLLLVFVTVLLTVSVHAQKTADIGIWGGTLTSVHGDMDEDAPFQSFNLNFGAYFRYNFNARVAMRAMFLTGTFASEGTVEGAPWEFDKSVQDLTLQAEINYLRYILGKKKLRFSPYVTFGIGVAYFPYNFTVGRLATDPDGPAGIMGFNPDHPELNGGVVGDYEESITTLTIPFGMGFKYTIGERLGLGVEYQMRKYMSDKLDDLDDPLAYVKGAETVTYNDGSHNNDWAGYLGVHLTYMIFTGKKACPAYDAKNW